MLPTLRETCKSPYSRPVLIRPLAVSPDLKIGMRWMKRRFQPKSSSSRQEERKASSNAQNAGFRATLHSWEIDFVHLEPNQLFRLAHSRRMSSEFYRPLGSPSPGVTFEVTVAQAAATVEREAARARLRGLRLATACDGLRPSQPASYLFISLNSAASIGCLSELSMSQQRNGSLHQAGRKTQRES